MDVMSMKLTKIPKTPSRPPRNRDWIDYHRKMESKYRYFVRGEGLAPFYTNAEIDEIIAHLKDAPVFEILDNKWDNDKWDVQPYKYRITVHGNYEYFGNPEEKYHTVKHSVPVGVRLNGIWQEKHYQDNGCTFYWSKSGWCTARTADGLYNRSESGEWVVWRGRVAKKVGNIPQDALLPNARGMKAVKWRGFFDDIVMFLVEDGLDKRFL